MPMYRITWTSIREGKDALEAIENSKPRESLRKDGSFLDPGLPRADEIVLVKGEWMLKAHQDLQRELAKPRQRRHLSEVGGILS